MPARTATPYAATAPGARDTACEGAGVPELALRAELPLHGAAPPAGRSQPPAAGVPAEFLPLQAVAVTAGPPTGIGPSLLVDRKASCQVERHQ
ncbi:hypothetical protein [Streptomyces decoyicus]